MANVVHFVWPEIGTTAPIVALVLSLAVFVFGALSGARANKARMIFAVGLATVIGWLTMPLAVKAALAVHLPDTNTGFMILITVMMGFVAAVATSIYEIITVTFPDIGMAPKK